MTKAHSFTLSQLFVWVILVAMVIVCARALISNFTYGVIFSVIAVIAWCYVRKTIRIWPTAGSRTKFFGVFISTIYCCIFLVLATGIEADRNARTVKILAVDLMLDSRFHKIKTERTTRKIECISIDGAVKTEEDFDVLQEKVLSFNWRRNPILSWDVHVLETGDSYAVWDHERVGARRVITSAEQQIDFLKVSRLAGNIFNEIDIECSQENERVFVHISGNVRSEEELDKLIAWTVDQSRERSWNDSNFYYHWDVSVVESGNRYSQHPSVT